MLEKLGRAPAAVCLQTPLSKTLMALLWNPLQGEAVPPPAPQKTFRQRTKENLRDTYENFKLFQDLQNKVTEIRAEMQVGKLGFKPPKSVPQVKTSWRRPGLRVSGSTVRKGVLICAHLK